jgi:2,4-dienoyl-CoA reductase-like NADH-dependent reductase (Old Yellow Enzyme family)
MPIFLYQMSSKPMFSELKLNNKRVPNRFTVAPMTRVSATTHGCATAKMQSYYQRFAKGGFGLIITEGLYTDKEFSQGYKFQPGLVNDEQSNSWQEVIADVHAEDSIVIAQLMHAGALSQFNAHVEDNVAPSAIQPKGEQLPFYYGEGQYKLPKEITASQIESVINGFVQSALLAKKSGFDGVEVHAANGYLLDQFLTPYTNTRQDEYGGSVQNRLRIHSNIVKRVRAAVGDDFVIGIRLSQAKVNDYVHKWQGVKEATEIFTHIDKLPLDYIHITEKNALSPAFDDGLSLFEIAKLQTKKPVILNGEIIDKVTAEEAINAGADFISIGKMALSNPNFATLIKNDQPLKAFNFDLLMPIANIENQLSYENKNHCNAKK